MTQLEQYERDFICETYPQYGVSEIAQKLERSPMTIRKCIKELSLESNEDDAGRTPSHDWPSIWYAYQVLGSYVDAALATGVSRQVVAYCVQRMILAGSKSRLASWNRYARKSGRHEYQPIDVNVGYPLREDKAEWLNGPVKRIESWMERLPGLNKARSRKNKNTVTELARKAGLNPRTVRGRIARGWSLKDALALPANSKSDAGEVGRYARWRDPDDAPVAQLAVRHGLHPNTVYSRMKRGWSLEEALGKKARKRSDVVASYGD